MTGRPGAGGHQDGPDPRPIFTPWDALPRAGRLLAVDWGTKRIGLAISDPTQTLAQPLATLRRRQGRRFPLTQLQAHLETYQPTGILVGLPLDAEGREGPAALAAREMGALLAAKIGLPVALVDERMTTARIHAARRETGARASRRGPDADQLAATLLLQSVLDRRHP
jgi:putative Holliday junction resolvase